MAFKMKTKQIFERHLINVNYQTKPKLIKAESEPKEKRLNLELSFNFLFGMLFTFYMCRYTDMSNIKILSSIILLAVLNELISVLQQIYKAEKENK